MANPPKSVLQDWVGTLPLRMQTVLLCALRGPDGLPKGHTAKQLVRHIRSVVLIDADPSNPFIQGRVFTLQESAQRVVSLLDQLNVHFVAHMMHACEIIGYKHPDVLVRDTWHHVYLTLIHGLHVAPETEKDLNGRLGRTDIG